MNAVLYDAAILVAADRNDRPTWADHKARLELGLVPLVPAPVVLGKSKTTDVSDAVVVAMALRLDAVILTSDQDDMRRLVAASGRDIAVVG